MARGLEPKFVIMQAAARENPRMRRVFGWIGAGLLTVILVGWCLSLLRKLAHPHLRICTYMVTMVCVFQAVRLLRDQGVIVIPVNSTVVSVVELCVTILYFCLILIFQIQNHESKKNHVRLRLAEASENSRIVSDPIPHRHVLEKASVT